jgi:hypothetical protein
VLGVKLQPVVAPFAYRRDGRPGALSAAEARREVASYEDAFSPGGVRLFRTHAAKLASGATQHRTCNQELRRVSVMPDGRMTLCDMDPGGGDVCFQAGFLAGWGRLVERWRSRETCGCQRGEAPC